ncbi:hypothetical protein BJ085DRAFT_16427, partial [Dimargaris cristalligena]
LYQRYEALLAVVYRFPQAHETYMPIIDMVDQAVKDWEAMGADSRTDMHTLVQMLYRMSRYTYNSLHVYRHLVHSLIRYGDYLEAELALHAYWGECKRYLEQKRVSGTADKSGGDSSAPEAADRLATDMTQLTVEPVVPERRKVEQESVSDMVQTLVVGAHMLNTYLDKFRDSHDIIEAALALSKEPGSNLPGRLLAQVHHQMGVSASQICLRAEDPEKRAKYQELALQSYRKAIDLDSSDAEIHYHYALQYAVSRNTEQAVLTVKQAIGLRPDHLNAWNLLALLISSQKDYHRALKICEVGCRESEWCDIDAEIQQAVLSHITQCLIYELLHGPQSAVQLHSILFSLYGRIYGQEAGSHPQNHTALISMTLTHRPLLAGFAASPGIVGSGYTGGSVNTNHLVSATTASGRPSSSAGVVPLLPPTSGGEKSESGEPPNSGSQDGKSRSGDGTGTGTAAGTVVGTAPGTGTGTRTGGGTGSRSDTTKELYKTTLRRQRARKTLADLWLISAAVFRRLGRMKDAQAAIGEAENVYPDYPAVWCQYGLLMRRDPSHQNVAAIRHFLTGVALGPQDIPTRVHLARAYMRLNKAAIATGLLQEVTRGTGWDVAEAWTLLAQTTLGEGKVQLANEYLVFALELENAKPIRPFQALSW